MQYSFSRFALILCLGSALAACGSSPKKEDATQAAAPPNQLPSGQTAAVDPNLGPDGKPLNKNAVAMPVERVVYFDYDQSDVRTQDRALLEEHARYLNANSSVSVRLEGHADERGSREYNLALGERRSQAIARFLNIMGVGEQQATTLSYGEEKPMMIGHDDASWQQNRRVEFVYSGGQ